MEENSHTLKDQEVNENRPLVIAVGASAGGLEALSLLVGALPEKLECIYVVAQHMSPTHRSMMADILSRETSLKVCEAADGEHPAPDVIYIIPPGVNLVFKNERFHLIKLKPEIVPKPSIDVLFQSIADTFEERAVGIVLSGTGSDGTRGLRAIKAAGGITFVQIPETAKYDGMPRSAIDACVADRILAPEHVGRELERLVRFPGHVLKFDNLEQAPSELTELFNRVQQRTKIDFSSYKLSTVQRRLQRRMVATEAHTLAEYLHYAELHPTELEALAKETLISVTEFFRDKDAFRSLTRLAKELLQQKRTGDEVRIWVVGCATGEEAYSMAILFFELIAEQGSNVSLQIFATDIDNDALTVARRGIYSKSAVAEMPQEYVLKYFQVTGNGYEPIKVIRDSVTFARQDIAADPPFLRLDLISCRNVMIYFNNDLQAKVLSIFRYALRDDGLLFLGRSETVNQQESIFAMADRRARIFRPRGQGNPISFAKFVRGTMPNSVKKSTKSHENIFLRAVVDHYAPSMLIDSGFRILHSHGNVNLFINFPSGSPEMNLSQLIVPEFSHEILTTVHRVRRQKKSASSRKRKIGSLHGATWQIVIHPVTSDYENEYFLVSFVAVSAKNSKLNEDNADSHYVDTSDEKIQDELALTREQLQNLMEEMSSSNEEMQALNEEIQAANEEMQAANEELEASNEELQATNEELISVNEESQIKSAELAAVNAEFESVYNTMDFPVLVFDTDLFLSRSNVAANRTYDLLVPGRKQHASRFNFPSYLQNIQEKLTDALNDCLKQNFSVKSGDKAYQILVTPVLNSTGLPQGVILVIFDNSDLIAAQEKIRESQQRLLSIMNNSVSVVMLKDATGRYEFINKRFEELVGLQTNDVIGKTDSQLFNREIAEFLRGKDLDAMRKESVLESIDELHLPTGTIWLESSRFPIYDHAGVVCSICTQASDITHRRQADEQLRLAAKVFDRAGEAIMITTPDGTIITVNDAFTDITGYTLLDVVGKNPKILKSGQHSEDFYESMWSDLALQGAWQGEIVNKRKNGDIFTEWLTINSVKNHENAVINYVSIFRDITSLKNSQKRIEFLATHDGLTGLPNRNLFIDRLNHTLSVAKRRNFKIAVMFIDLDNFKNINDNLGHDIGDVLLKEAAERLQGCMRDSDTLARLGGDEFVAIIVDCEISTVQTVASRIVNFLGTSFHINDNSLFVSASIGISLYPTDGQDSIDLLKNADIAMYQAKERGRNQYQFFANEMRVMALQRMSHESGLRVALDAGYFHMVYQPKIDVKTGLISGAEALLRWHDPLLGVVSPTQFIPVAEACGLIVPIGNRVFEMVIAQIASWNSRGVDVPTISINMSAHQLRDVGLVEKIKNWLKNSGVRATNVCIELTESALMERLDHVNEQLVQLQNLGITLSIDDFGTGYSSLSYLRKLPINELKIDRSFVDGIADQPDDRSIAKTVIHMAHALGLNVVAEGVETVEQMNILTADGCDVVQGNLYHFPLTADEFFKIISKINDKKV